MTENNMESISDNEELIQKVKKSQPCHLVWQYLSWNMDKTFASCDLCQQQYGSKTGVSTIKGYFMTNHQNKWKEIKKQAMITIKPVAQYIKLDEKKIAKLNVLFLQWIIRDQQSFSIVSDSDFRDFVEALNPQYKLLCWQVISTKVQHLYEEQ
ncbi:18147_t:CDS:1 [Acaulospora morrowiae]|uniref:18147_t:CDS:1 n=1 Tax=Acaulospora morrowiae TaxID=94023 RepID=A0A9N9HUZ1_9GLOM|nr:18147_t:CDS:1 [Acaulospora morrowiae]